ncbi:MAG: VacB/RNase II family 3'-5' exoribonuclease, partial [Nitrospinae bacterium]|nr:VacB/RNase II family 3'-5' exoribonuclease [Nitrospinota bacterium]
DTPFPEGVEDLRGLCAFTVDPFDARDRDDAVSIEKLRAGGRRLGVHIADVGHYVKRGGAVDKEARSRGVSVYLPDRAVPMLPPRLTGEVCSLREGAVRRTLSVFIDFDRYGNRTGVRLTFARIRSRASLTYRGAAAVLEGEKIPQEEEAESARALEEPLRQLSALADSLQAERMKQGSLDFDLPEAQVLLDQEGMPVDIARAPRTSAHRLVEECMLAANRAVAEYLAEAGGASVFRVHEAPDEEKLEGLRAILSRLGLKAPGVKDLERPGGFQEVFEAVRGSDVERYVNLAALRSMKLARYEAAPALHFGLGFERYAHFTSPIRRYADLCVHRRLARLMRGEGGKPQAKPLAALCRDISERDRTAEAASREMVDFMKALFMRDKVGERFRGHVSGVANFGIFVELEDIYVEGMVPLELMTDDYYGFIPEEHAVLGRRTGRRFRLGDPVTVRVEGVDLAGRRVTFQLLAGGTREVIGDAAESRRANLADRRRPERKKLSSPRRGKRGKPSPGRGRRR